MLSTYKVLKYLKEYGVTVSSERNSSKRKLSGTYSLTGEKRIQIFVCNINFFWKLEPKTADIVDNNH
jgi:hypothetical protein